jgi:hypothetical protein
MIAVTPLISARMPLLFDHNLQFFLFPLNPFAAKAANKRLLGTPLKSLFGTKSHKNEQSFTMLTWGVYNANRRTAHSVLSKTPKTIIANQFRRSEGIDCVVELYTRRWTPGTQGDITFSQLVLKRLTLRGNDNSREHFYLS